MKASELRLGNWVASGANKENPETWIIGKVESISSTSSRFEQIEVETEESFEWFFKDSYFGIPLTEDWLKKFGFKPFAKDWSKNGIIIHTRKRGFVLRKSVPIIESVHQLQNLYFCLVGEELQIKKTAQ